MGTAAKICCCCAAAVSLIMASAPADASFIVSGTVDGLDVAAEAEFAIDGGNPDLLVMTLTNTLDAAMSGRAQTVTGLLFTINGADPDLMLTSATGTVDYRDNPDAFPGTPNTNLLTTVVAGGNHGPPHWEFESALGGELSSVATFEYGLSSIGGSASGYTGIWNGNNLDGDPWGIVSQTADVDSPPFGNGNAPYPRWARQTATFVFSGFSGLSLSDIDPKVRFMFGSEPNGTIDTPEPAGLVLALSAAGLALVFRRR